MSLSRTSFLTDPNEPYKLTYSITQLSPRRRDVSWIIYIYIYILDAMNPFEIARQDFLAKVSEEEKALLEDRWSCRGYTRRYRGS